VRRTDAVPGSAYHSAHDDHTGGASLGVGLGSATRRALTKLAEFVGELSRRKVIRTVGAYLVMAFVALEVVNEVFGAPRLVLIVFAVGLPITIALAWWLEITPEGLRRELSAEEAAARSAPRGATPVKELRADSIAVLPFENLSPDPDNEYFSDGITEDIIASIARIQGMRVLSRTSVAQYKQRSRSVAEIAGELGVATVVVGSVRRSGRQLRIVAQVVDGRGEGSLWSDTYDRDLEDVFRVQSEVAAQVANAVRRELSPAEKTRIEVRGTTQPEAYDLYLRGRFLWNRRDEDSVAESVDFFTRALELDPSFALAHVGLADAYTILGIYGARAPTDVAAAARESAHEALVVDPDLGEAIASLACVTAVFDWDWPGAERGFLRALRLSPSYATAHQWYAMNLLTPLGRFREAYAALDRAHALDPASVAVAVSRGIVAFYARELESARRDFEGLAALHPDFALVHHFLAQCHAAAGRWDQAVASAEAAVRLSSASSETLACQGHALAKKGSLSDAEGVLDTLIDRSKQRYVSPALLAQVLLGLGRQEEALDRLERAADARAVDLIWLGVRPAYDPLRATPRFRALTERVGLA
jgi:TolB-like protein